MDSKDKNEEEEEEVWEPEPAGDDDDYACDECTFSFFSFLFLSIF